MKQLSITLPALALVVALSGSAMAENGAINTATLNEMGLAGIEMMSDEAAMEIRGQGFSQVFGDSFAKLSVGNSIVGIPGNSIPCNGNCGHGSWFLGGRHGSTETSNNYSANGLHMAMGSSFSEAMFSESMTVEVSVNGMVSKTVTTLSLSIGAGGMASASSL